MSFKLRALSSALAVCISFSAVYGISSSVNTIPANAAESIEDSMDWGTVKIGGGGFVSGIVTGQKEMYARTDVGGAYKYNYETESWEQLLSFITDADRGYLSVDAMAIDPTDDNTVYFLCGCAYFSDERTVIFKTTDGGKTFTKIDVSSEIKVMGNGDGRHCGEAIAVDPDNPDVIYCGGDVAFGKSALIKSTDGGMTWSPVIGYDDLGLFSETTKWPTWKNNIARSVTSDAYNNQNGVATIAIQDGKVYVGTSIKGVENVHVADMKDDKFTVLSKDLPTGSFPARINKDANGNLLINYVGALAFGGSGGSIYRYDTKAGTVTDISPKENTSFSACVSLPDDANTLVATTCGVWSSQLWYKDAWNDDKVCWGDQFYRSTDGGKTWESITPGNEKSWGGPLQADYLQDGGYDWIRNKAIHWCGAIVLDPRNSDRIFITSGNGVFACDNIWDELPQYYFHPDGIEEVVALDMVSVPGGNPYSAIGDYDGFEHADLTKPGKQHSPNMGSTGAIAYCPQNPDVMIRIAENQNDVSSGFYTLDGGETWTKMSNSPGGKAAITQLDKDTYRFFKSGKDDGAVSYSDDFGETWQSCSGIPSTYGSKPTYMFVEPDQPNVVYAYATYYNSSWSYSKTEPDITDACYKLCISTDYGKTFTSTDICKYDMCDSAARIAYLGEGELILGAGWNGMYHVSVKDGKITSNEKIDGVSYCKTVGYGAPEKEGDVNTLYIYGKPEDSDPEGIYRSQDGGKTWVCINTENLYGGTGNGNFLVGDMNEFGKVYMSTVGCGIVYGQLSGNTNPTTKPTGSTSADTLYGDANLDGAVDIADAVAVASYVGDSKANALKAQGLINADVQGNGNGVNASDALTIQQYIAGVLKELPVK